MASGIKNGMFVIGNLVKNIYEEKENVLDLAPDIVSSGKITKMMSKFIITPNVVVDDKLKYMDNTVFKDLVKTQMMTFTGIVTQAIRVMVEMHNVEPMIAINKINPYDSANKAYELYKAGIESFDYVSDLLNSNTLLPATEASNKTVDNNLAIQKDVASFINTYEVQVSFSNGSGDARVLVIPVIIYPNITFTNVHTLIHNRIASNNGKYLSDVINDYKAGLKSFMDIITATSLVKEYKNHKLTNSNDFAKYLNKTDKVSTFKDLLHNQNSFSKNFNIYLFSSEYETTVNKLLKGNVHKDLYKDKLADDLMAFSITFVDVEREELTYFIDSIPGFSVLSFAMLKKEKDSDISKVVKELMQNKSPF